MRAPGSSSAVIPRCGIGAGRRLLVVLNPLAAAGRARARAGPLLDQLRRRGLVVEVEPLASAGQVADLVAARARGDVAVVAAGGDGTVNAVARALWRAGRAGTPLGILPLGTGNDAARQVGMAHADQAVAAVSGGATRAIDAIEVQCRSGAGTETHLALVYAAAGFAADVLRRTTPSVKRWFGRRGCYTVGIVRALAGLACPEMRVVTERRACSEPLLLAAACNGERAGGGILRLAPGARIDDGRFDVCLIRALSRRRLLWRLPRLLRGTHAALAEVEAFPATQLAVEARPAVGVQVDGEVCGTTPATFRLRPGALRLLVPP